MKKRDALDLLSDLKIRVHQDPVKQIHFVDVFKALIKRIFIHKMLDYKLSPNLSKKIKNNWGKKHKVSQFKEKSKYNALQQQAGLIIVKWARNQLKESFKKPDRKPKKKDGVEYQKSNITTLYKQQAKIIFNMINDIDEDDALKNIE